MSTLYLLHNTSYKYNLFYVYTSYHLNSEDVLHIVFLIPKVAFLLNVLVHDIMVYMAHDFAYDMTFDYNPTYECIFFTTV